MCVRVYQIHPINYFYSSLYTYIFIFSHFASHCFSLSKHTVEMCNLPLLGYVIVLDNEISKCCCTIYHIPICSSQHPEGNIPNMRNLINLHPG